MPLPPPAPRKNVHDRVIAMRTYEREDGLFDVEGRVSDTKPFDFIRPNGPGTVPTGEFIHDMWIRLTIDREFVVREVAAASDTTPWALCKEAEATLQVLVGRTVGRGWSAFIKEKLRGTASCTHLMEMLIPMATVAFQGMRPRLGKSGDPGYLLDTCWSFSAEREVVMRVWPHLARPPKSSTT
ncbi:DUF2889 domain-containing protein [Ramlibacter sp.]|uniref:DUF2889 domain-containing protein n=1 Tax=Ramlibacter sp. TaxID=1917967 RepID=UPI003D0C9EBC